MFGPASPPNDRGQYLLSVSLPKDQSPRAACRGVRWHTRGKRAGICVLLRCQQCLTMGSVAQHFLPSIGAPVSMTASGAMDPIMTPSVRRIEQGQGDQPGKREGATAECATSAWSTAVCCGRVLVRPAATGRSPVISCVPGKLIARALADSSIPRKPKFADSSAFRRLPVAPVRFVGH